MKILKQMAVAAAGVLAVWSLTGVGGWADGAFSQHAALKWGIYTLAMAHLTITAMSLSFHRAHTHHGVRFHPVLDAGMQVWLWLVTSMSKLDWVSVHHYHHATSDTERDPHSPVHKGFWRVLLLGAHDYTRAKRSPEVLRIRKRLPANQLERWLDAHSMLGPILLTAASLCAFGWLWGSVLSLTHFLISPVFAVGGVNTLAHQWGYRNHLTRDNSRNLGLWLAPLNWVICGELDHNNHHAKPRSCSFRHRWFELDVGYLYIQMLEKLRLARVLEVYPVRRFSSS